MGVVDAGERFAGGVFVKARGSNGKALVWRQPIEPRIGLDRGEVRVARVGEDDETVGTGRPCCFSRAQFQAFPPARAASAGVSSSSDRKGTIQLYRSGTFHCVTARRLMTHAATHNTSAVNAKVAATMGRRSMIDSTWPLLKKNANGSNE